MHVFVCWWIHIHVQVHMEARGKTHVSSFGTLATSLRQGLPWPGTHQVSKASWPVDPRDHIVSVSPVLRLQPCITIPGIFPWVVVIKRRSSHLEGKHPTVRVSSQQTLFWVVL